MRLLLVAVLALALAACKADPVAPEAPHRATFAGTVALDATVAPMPLPPASVADGPPLVACYVSSDGEHWFPVAQWPTGAGEPSCRIALAPGDPHVELLNVPPGWGYRVLVLW